jgi:DNA-binding transcriptional ArsR family regulator
MDKVNPMELRCAGYFKALGDPERLRIIRCLHGGSRHVSELAALLGSEVVNVSHHLGVLRHASLVVDEKRGRFVYYRLHPDVAPQQGQDGTFFLDFGCCRVELPAN